MGWNDYKETLGPCLEAANNWRSPEKTWPQKEALPPSEQAGQEASCLQRAMGTILTIAAVEHESLPSARCLFNEYDVGNLLDRYADGMAAVFEEVPLEDTRHPWFVNNDVIHAAVFLGRFDLIKRNYRACHVDPGKKQMPSTRVYSELARGLYLLIHAKPFTAVELKAKGGEKTIAPLVHLIEACGSGGEIERAVEQVDIGFEKRNRDKRIEAPFTMGQGTMPVQWDVYKTSILAIHEHNRGTHNSA
jgi:hypothetical protein